MDIPLVQRQLEALCPCVLETEDGDPGEAPVKLYNNAFAAPAESITEMYAMPLPSDIDPTPVVSFFYYLFFGMMLSDAGYGLLLVLGAAFLLRKCRPEEAMGPQSAAVPQLRGVHHSLGSGVRQLLRQRAGNHRQNLFPHRLDHAQAHRSDSRRGDAAGSGRRPGLCADSDRYGREVLYAVACRRPPGRRVRHPASG